MPGVKSTNRNFNKSAATSNNTAPQQNRSHYAAAHTVFFRKWHTAVHRKANKTLPPEWTRNNK